MSRHRITVAGGAATAALLATALMVPATATPPSDGAPDSAAAEKSDDRADALEAERRELTQRATELVISGEREVQDRGGSKAVRVAPGQQWSTREGYASRGSVLIGRTSLTE